MDITKPKIDYLIGVDGGGTSTRIVITNRAQQALGRTKGGPSALAQGLEKAWAQINATLKDAWHAAGLPPAPLEQCAMGLGLSGCHNPKWRAEFEAMQPGFGAFALDTDTFTALLGAHDGQAGSLIICGTGSVGETLYANGDRKAVGGWGFPSFADEGSGAWIGLHAIHLAQAAIDKRRPASPLTDAILSLHGPTRGDLFVWCGDAGQTGFASLAPIVIEHAHHDPAAEAILVAAGKEIAQIADALDADAALPLTVYGGLTEPIQPYLPPTLLTRLRPAKNDALTGALLLLQRTQAF